MWTLLSVDIIECVGHCCVHVWALFGMCPLVYVGILGCVCGHCACVMLCVYALLTVWALLGVCGHCYMCVCILGCVTVGIVVCVVMCVYVCVCTHALLGHNCATLRVLEALRSEQQ